MNNRKKKDVELEARREKSQSRIQTTDLKFGRCVP